LTFFQFVTCIIERANATGKELSSYEAAYALNDHHWSPFYYQLLPCTVNYTLIGEFEHFQEDSTAAIELFNMNATVKKTNPTKSDKTLAEYFSELNKELVEAVRVLYSKDFELFGYDDTPPYHFD